MKRLLSISLVFFLMLCLSACDINWSNFDLTKHNFGLTDDSSDTQSSSDAISVSDTAEADIASEEILNYTVPENENVVYTSWEVVYSEDFRSMAQDKLLEMANLMSSLSALKANLSEYSAVNAIAADSDFSKLLNNIRAWSYGAKNYPTDNLSDKDRDILDKLILIGVDTAEYGAKLPALLVTYNTEMIGSYEELIISQIVALDNILV